MGLKSVILNTSQTLDSEYKKIPKDISMALNNSVLIKRNVSLNDSGISKLTTTTKVLGDYSEQESMILLNNQQTLNQQFTTLRKESYKTKVTRLEMLR